MRRIGICVLAGLGLVAAGCASIGAAQTANTMGKGGLQLGVDAAAESVDVNANAKCGGTDPRCNLTFPRIDVAVRYGVTDQIDLGAKVGSSLVELDSKFQLTSPANQGFVLSLAPSIGGFVTKPKDATIVSGVMGAKLHLLMGIGLGPHQLVIGPELVDLLLEGAGSDNHLHNILMVGTSLGCAFKLTDGFRIMPEIGLLIPLSPKPANFVIEDNFSGYLSSAGLVWQAGLAFLFGSYTQPSAMPEATLQPPAALPAKDSIPAPSSAPPGSSYPPPPPNYATPSEPPASSYPPPPKD